MMLVSISDCVIHFDCFLSPFLNLQAKWTEKKYFRSLVKGSSVDRDKSSENYDYRLLREFQELAAKSIDKDCIFSFDLKDIASMDNGSLVAETKMSHEQQANHMFFVRHEKHLSSVDL